MKADPPVDLTLQDFREQGAVLEKDVPKATITAEDAQLVESLITAAKAAVKSLREYLEHAGKLRSVDSNQFKAAETALHAIRVKPTSGRAAQFMKQLSQAPEEKVK